MSELRTNKPEKDSPELIPPPGNEKWKHAVLVKESLLDSEVEQSQIPEKRGELRFSDYGSWQWKKGKQRWLRAQNPFFQADFNSLYDVWDGKMGVEVIGKNIDAVTDVLGKTITEEAKLSAQLDYRKAGVPLIYDLARDEEGKMLMIMEKIKGPTLREYYEQDIHPQRSRSFDVKNTAKIVREIAEAIDYLAKKGIVHKDIKPENIIIDENLNRARLIDYGTTSITTGDVGLGLPQYRPPESIEENTHLYQSDIYSLGVIASEMVLHPMTRKSPVKRSHRMFLKYDKLADTFPQTFVEVDGNELPISEAYNEEQLERLKQVFFKVLAIDLSQRYQTATEFASDLE